MATPRSSSAVADGQAPVAPPAEGAPSGLAHVATVSFVAARAAPSAGFWISLGGGLALARASERSGLRQAFGASLAAMLETVAIMGPARFGVPLTQALTAPLLGHLEARRAAPLVQWATAAAVRLAHNALAVAFFIWVITGGLDAYAGTHDAMLARLPLVPGGAAAALAFTAAGVLAWTVFASAVQVAVYRRGLRTWPTGPGEATATGDLAAPATARGRFDPRAVALAAAIAFGLLLSGTAWLLLGAVASWLGVSWAAARADREPVAAGTVLAGLLALTALAFALVGGLGLDVALQRGCRAGLLVLVATWLRAAAGSTGLREVSRRALRRLRRLPSVPEAARVLDELGGSRLLPAGRALVDEVGAARRRPAPVVDAVVRWVAQESARFRPAPPAPREVLRVRVVDVALVALAAAAAAAAAGI